MAYSYVKHNQKAVLNQGNRSTGQLKGFADKRAEFIAQGKLLEKIRRHTYPAQCKLQINGIEYKTINDIKQSEAGKLIQWNNRWNPVIHDLISREDITNFPSMSEFTASIGEALPDISLEHIDEHLTHIEGELNTNLKDSDIKNLEAKAEKDQAKATLKEYRNIILGCREIVNSIPGEESNVLKKKLFIIEIRLARALTIIDDELLTKTYQQPRTYKCWFLSIFEGLRRSGLVYPILTNLGQTDSPINWQAIFERKFMHPYATSTPEALPADPVEAEFFKAIRKISPAKKVTDFTTKTIKYITQITNRNSRPPKKEETTGKVSGTEDIMKPFFNMVLPQYTYQLEEWSIIGNREQRWAAFPNVGRVQITPDCTRICFYTVDKPGHAMFYLEKFKNDKNKLRIKVYNQSNSSSTNFPLKKINLLQKHTFTLKS